MEIEDKPTFIGAVLLYFSMVTIVLSVLLLYKEYRLEREDRKKWLIITGYVSLAVSILLFLSVIAYFILKHIF
jgi:hypothetical protein